MKYIHDFIVTKNINLNQEHFILNLQAPSALPEILPGQFMEILINDLKSTFLRRPISFHNVDYKNNIISLFIKRVGEGTRHLGNLEQNDILNIVYPLGNSFTIPDDNNFLLIGGGCGVAPLLYLANYLNKKGFEPSVLIGAKTYNDIHELDIFKKFGKIYIITEDGSLGEKGLVTEHSIISTHHSAFSKIYACGPELMLKAVAKVAKKIKAELEVSLENTMACGIGACLCCVVETGEGNKCVCTEGPVFNVKDLKWNN